MRLNNEDVEENWKHRKRIYYMYIGYNFPINS